MFQLVPSSLAMYTTRRPSCDQSVAILSIPLRISRFSSAPLVVSLLKRFGGKPSRGEANSTLPLSGAQTGPRSKSPNVKRLGTPRESINHTEILFADSRRSTATVLPSEEMRGKRNGPTGPSVDSRVPSRRYHTNCVGWNRLPVQYTSTPSRETEKE